METPGKQLMDLIDSVSFVATGTYITPEGWQDYGPHRVWTPEAEAKINEFLQEQKDIREHAKEMNEAPKGAKCRRCGTEEIPLKQCIDWNDMGAQYFLCWKCWRENPREDWVPKT